MGKHPGKSGVSLGSNLQLTCDVTGAPTQACRPAISPLHHEHRLWFPHKTSAALGQQNGNFLGLTGELWAVVGGRKFSPHFSKVTAGPWLL